MAKKKNLNLDQTIAATSLPPKGVSLDKSAVRKEKKEFNVWDHLGLSAKVASSSVYWRNQSFRNAAKHFPAHPLLRTVDKFFPFAEVNGKRVPGGLFMDEIEDESQIEDCLKKAKALREEGYSYVYIAPGMDLQDVLSQLDKRSYGDNLSGGAR